MRQHATDQITGAVHTFSEALIHTPFVGEPIEIVFVAVHRNVDQSMEMRGEGSRVPVCEHSPPPYGPDRQRLHLRREETLKHAGELRRAHVELARL